MLLPVVTALTFALPAQLGDGAPVPDEDRAPSHADTRGGNECPALFGAALDVEERRASREARLEDVSRSEVLLDVVHSDPAWQTPKPMRVHGFDVLGVEASPDGEPFARVHLSEAWSETCPAGDYLVRPDDSLGSEGAVLAVLDEGLLAEHKGQLIFLPTSGTHPPQFRMIWQSPFALNITPGSNASIGGSNGSAPKRNTARAASAKNDRSKQQRAKAQAKAAAENRRTMARPGRPRG